MGAKERGEMIMRLEWGSALLVMFCFLKNKEHSEEILAKQNLLNLGDDFLFCFIIIAI